MEFLKKINKKWWLIISGIVVLVAIIIGVVIVAFGTNEKKLQKKMTEYAEKYYENAYYELAGSDEDTRKKFIKNYAEMGIKVDLNNLARYIATFEQTDKTVDDILKEFINSKTKKKCDPLESKAYYFPTEPYGKKDYKVKVELSCGF